MASNNPGFFGFILWNRQQYFVCIFGFFFLVVTYIYVNVYSQSYRWIFYQVVYGSHKYVQYMFDGDTLEY